MERKKMVVANWKMNKTSAEGVTFIQELREVARSCGKNVEIVVAPPFTAIRAVATVIGLDKVNIRLAAQDMHYEEDGAYTGAISAHMLKSEHIEYVIVGHSERREYFGETDAVVNKKAKAVFRAGMVPIICCGEPEVVRDEGVTGEWISDQITAALDGLSVEEISKLVIAYEPIWAIGTGKTATPAMAQVTCELIRALVAEMYDEGVARTMRILYGGSVTPFNAYVFMGEHDIDGALVGGASLEADSFGKIVKAAC